MITQLAPQTYRPSRLIDFRGQEPIVEFLKIKVNSTKKTQKATGHMLFLGPSGTGKTTLAQAFANELEGRFVSIMGNQIHTINEFFSLVYGFQGGEVLFIDEIHRLPASVQDGMLDFMESGKVVVTVGKRTMTRHLPQITIIGATTHWGNLREAFVQRFGYKANFVRYTKQQMINMTTERAYKAYGLNLHPVVAQQIAQVSMGVARQMANLLSSLVEIAEGITSGPINSNMITMPLLEKALQLQGYDPFVGLNAPSRAYLVALVENENQPMGIEAISKMINQQDTTVRDMIEPFLMSDVEMPTFDGLRILDQVKTGSMIKLTPRGRVVTDLAKYYLTECSKLQSNRGWFSGEKLLCA